MGTAEEGTWGQLRRGKYLDTFVKHKKYHCSRAPCLLWVSLARLVHSEIPSWCRQAACPASDGVKLQLVFPVRRGVEPAIPTSYYGERILPLTCPAPHIRNIVSPAGNRTLARYSFAQLDCFTGVLHSQFNRFVVVWLSTIALENIFEIFLIFVPDWQDFKECIW